MALPPPPMPPPTATPAIVRPYAPPSAPWEAGHRGMDLAVAGPAPRGHERARPMVLSLTSGTVGFVGDVADLPVVTVDLGDGRRVTYQPVLASVRPGQAVRRGQVLGMVAAAGGHCGADRGCIHVGLRDDDRYWDPQFLLARMPAVLKPGS